MKNLLLLILTFCSLSTFAQSHHQIDQANDPTHKDSVSTPLITLLNIGKGDDKVNTQHVELHFKRHLNSKSIIGVKFATWRLFQPMGILWWDGLLDKVESPTEFYPRYLRETGLGVSYQHML